MNSRARSKVVASGVKSSRCSRSYLKPASALLKRAAGGPNRSEGRPYRGPLGSVTVSLMAEKVLTQSDGEVTPPRARQNSSRAVLGENIREGGVKGALTLHASMIIVHISWVIHTFLNCDTTC